MTSFGQPLDAAGPRRCWRWLAVAGVIRDIAFLSMDPERHGRRDLAWRLINGWLSATGHVAALPGLRWHGSIVR